MGVYHVVMLSFKPLATPEEVQDTCNRMMALKYNCLHPETSEPYLKMAIGGADTAMLGNAEERITHAFVSEFENDGDRTYYLEKDPAYAAFLEDTKGIIETTRTVDFRDGVF
ncbi:stress responsive A/B barrel domain-containing protein [Podospora australis]|uniref:Stress responsive A/B barrel domain-containing protein n=1 Tax=Podospora australis TaxID=1536484 RepID=A0AAN6X3Q6_9PEZI|nr:stress responsive A/B barrel domain-containing protein [Podospora australis]